MKTTKYLKPVASLFSLAAVLFLNLSVQAQNPAPAKPQSKPVVLTGGTIHLGNGKVIKNGVISFIGCLPGFYFCLQQFPVTL